MTADQIAFWTLVAAVIAIFVGIWAAIEARLAAKYAKDAPTKEDFKRLENHAAATSGHLLKQGRREENMALASRVSMLVSGRSYEDEGLNFSITSRNLTVKFVCVDLYTELGTSYGSAPCVHESASTYFIHIALEDATRWFRACTAPQSNPNAASLILRVNMEVEEDGGQGYKEMPVRLVKVQVADTRTEPAETYGKLISQAWEIHGEV